MLHASSHHVRMLVRVCVRVGVCVQNLQYHVKITALPACRQKYVYNPTIPSKLLECYYPPICTYIYADSHTDSHKHTDGHRHTDTGHTNTRTHGHTDTQTCTRDTVQRTSPCRSRPRTLQCQTLQDVVSPAPNEASQRHCFSRRAS